MRRVHYFSISTWLVLICTFVGGFVHEANANECKAYGAARLSEGWHWHYPRETPNVRNGNRKLICRSGRQGWLYTRDDMPGQYFVADTNWRKKTRTHDTLCDAVAQFCAQ